MALLAEHIPEDGGKFVGLIGQSHVGAALDEGVFGLAGGGNAREVAFHVGGKDRHAGVRKPFRQDLQGDGLAGAGRARHQPVTIAEFEIEHFVFAALADDDRMLGRRDGSGRCAPSALLCAAFSPAVSTP